MLTSVRAAPVAAARRLHRRTERTATGRFLAEGPRVVREALAEHERRGELVVDLFLTPEAADRNPDLVDRASLASIPTHLVTDQVAAAVAETRTPQGIVAVCTTPASSLDDLGASPRLVALLADVSDPGNAGTVVRVADAAGADGVVLSGSAVDPYNGKCVRASAGSVFHLPVITASDIAAALDALRTTGLTVLVADAKASLDLDEAERHGLLARPTCWVFGNEAHGVPVGVATLADEAIRVPIYGRAESLNLATAAAICLHTSARVNSAKH